MKQKKMWLVIIATLVIAILSGTAALAADKAGTLSIEYVDASGAAQTPEYCLPVAADKKIDSNKVIFARNSVGHVVGFKNSKYTNVKSIRLTRKNYTLKVGTTQKIKAKISLVDKNKKHVPKNYGPRFRYKSSDKAIATVSKSGKIKGTCTIYVYAINGKMQKAKVTVK